MKNHLAINVSVGDFYNPTKDLNVRYELMFGVLGLIVTGIFYVIFLLFPNPFLGSAIVILIAAISLAGTKSEREDKPPIPLQELEVIAFKKFLKLTFVVGIISLFVYLGFDENVVPYAATIVSSFNFSRAIGKIKPGDSQVLLFPSVFQALIVLLIMHQIVH
jgi:hypothetical protein